MTPVFPFSAIHGQDDLKTALLLNAIDPSLGGVLIRGPRGVAKSTSARALAELMPFGQFVNLPLGATEDVVIGSLDLEKIMSDGTVAFNPGLLAKADQGVLYVDEVNLLSDALVDVLLDVASSGVNYVERDGVSKTHPARICLIGTMNPDEGDVRPQLLDRFGLCIDLAGEYSVDQRLAIVKKRLAFEQNPELVREQAGPAMEALRTLLEKAHAQRSRVVFDDALLAYINQACMTAGVEGVRADLAALKASVALAALDEVNVVQQDHVDRVLPWVLSHRAQQRANSSDANPAPCGDSSPEEARMSEGQWGELPPIRVETSDRFVEVADSVKKSRRPSELGVRSR